MSVFMLDMNTLNEYATLNMKPEKLKKIRAEMGARQKDLAKILNIPVRTYQNWEQPEGSKSHRQIPEDAADRVRCLSELMAGSQGRGEHFPDEITWLQIPLRKMELHQLKSQAILDDKTLSLFVRECILNVM